MSNERRTISLPKLEFSVWYKWEERNKVPDKQYPGVYLISISKKEDLSGCIPRWKDVSYIGCTSNRNGLAARWRQINRSIVSGKKGHNAGRRIFSKMDSYKRWKEYLYVAAMTVRCNSGYPIYRDYLRMGWVAYLEYEAFAKCVRSTGRLPKYNKLKA